jgi:hypothetical protein
MRASLPKPTRERRGSRSRRGRAQPSCAPAQPTGAPASAVARMRAAGGPVDHACYSCACGYVFVAEVSTTVTCPHCQAGQAW